MMVSRAGAFGILMAAVGTLFLVPAHGSAQDSLSVACADFDSLSPWEGLIRCAEQGHVGAQVSLGIKYNTGGGVARGSVNRVREVVPEDLAEAVRWFRRAAEQGNAGAQFNLGTMYVRGRGVPEDLVLAYMWWDLSATQGIELAQGNIEKGRIEQRMTRDQIAEAQRLSREWIETHPPDGGN